MKISMESELDAVEFVDRLLFVVVIPAAAAVEVTRAVPYDRAKAMV